MTEGLSRASGRRHFRQIGRLTWGFATRRGCRLHVLLVFTAGVLLLRPLPPVPLRFRGSRNRRNGPTPTSSWPRRSREVAWQSTGSPPPRARSSRLLVPQPAAPTARRIIPKPNPAPPLRPTTQASPAPSGPIRSPTPTTQLSSSTASTSTPLRTPASGTTWAAGKHHGLRLTSRQRSRRFSALLSVWG